MIFPIPVNPRNYSFFPLTWALIAVNTILFILVFSLENEQTTLEKNYLTQANIHRTGLIYQHFLSPDKSFFRTTESEVETWGIQSLRDEKFMNALEKLEPAGDSVQFERWRKGAIEFRKEYLGRPTFQFGLSGVSNQPQSWLTYQFSHASWGHLFSNMVYLAILGAAVELLVGSYWLLFVYLGGGFLGGAAFLWLNSKNLLPMVGASGSISAIMTFYAIYEPKVRIRFFYFISPWKEHHGMIYLPTLLIFPLYLVSDWVSYFGSTQEWAGSIAYPAHLGGSLFGALVALTLRYALRVQPQSVPPLKYP